MRSAASCGQMARSWDGNLSISSVIKTICIMCLAESAVFREHSSDRSKADGIMQKTEHGTVPQNRCGDHEICLRIPGGCNCVRISGNAGENIRKKKQKLHFMEKAGYSEAVCNTRHIGMGFVCQESVPVTPAGWPVTEVER